MNLLQLRQKIETMKETKQRAQGKLENEMEKLQDTWSCSSLEEAEEIAEKLEGKKKKAKAMYEKAVEEYEEKWGCV